MLMVALVKVNEWLAGSPVADSGGLIVPLPVTVATPALAAVAGVAWTANTARATAPRTTGVARMRFMNRGTVGTAPSVRLALALRVGCRRKRPARRPPVL